MSEEEKEAIKYLKLFQGDLKEWSNKSLMANCLEKIFNLIDKLEKENNKLKQVQEPSGEFFMSKNGIIIKIIDNRGDIE